MMVWQRSGQSAKQKYRPRWCRGATTTRATGNTGIDRGWHQVVKQGLFAGFASLNVVVVPWTCEWNLMMESDGCVLDLHLSRCSLKLKSPIATFFVAFSSLEFLTSDHVAMNFFDFMLLTLADRW
ncbi:hypothetical protein NL676_023996 [Syzygium grande]|nr:hypothetical protein NL676_023996 [Syzygium grande]